MTTYDEIMHMTPEQLRVEIAKKCGYVEEWDDDDGWEWILYGVNDKIEDVCNSYTLPNYPADIEAAWELVKEIRFSGNEIGIDSDRNSSGGDIFTIVIFNYYYGQICELYGYIEVSADTIQMAICRAWLIWSEERRNG